MMKQLLFIKSRPWAVHRWCWFVAKQTKGPSHHSRRVTLLSDHKEDEEDGERERKEKKEGEG